MDITNIIQIMEEYKRCQISEIDSLIKKLAFDMNDTDYEVSSDILKLSKTALSTDHFIGSSNDFHNLAVTYSRIDYYDLACDFLDVGLMQFPFSVDLLAAYILYGLSCNRLNDCSRYYERLKEIDMSTWGWRGFTFSVDYLLSRLETEESTSENRNSIMDEVLSISSKCREVFPNEEYGYILEAKAYKSFNKLEDEERILDLGVKSVNVTPKCSVRLANIYFKRGEYSCALDYINKCLNEDAGSVASINLGFPYYLKVLSNISLFNQKYNDIQEDEEYLKGIEDIYLSYKIARRIIVDNEKIEELNMLVEIMEEKTGVLCN